MAQVHSHDFCVEPGKALAKPSSLSNGSKEREEMKKLSVPTKEDALTSQLPLPVQHLHQENPQGPARTAIREVTFGSREDVKVPALGTKAGSRRITAIVKGDGDSDSRDRRRRN